MTAFAVSSVIFILHYIYMWRTTLDWRSAFGRFSSPCTPFVYGRALWFWRALCDGGGEAQHSCWVRALYREYL